jgi:hypothetical protein
MDELIELVRSFGIDTVHSSEPRTYSLGPKGRANLAAAIAGRRPDTLILSDATPGGSGYARVGDDGWQACHRDDFIRFFAPPSCIGRRELNFNACREVWNLALARKLLGRGRPEVMAVNLEGGSKVRQSEARVAIRRSFASVAELRRRQW